MEIFCLKFRAWKGFCGAHALLLKVNGQMEIRGRGHIVLLILATVLR